MNHEKRSGLVAETIQRWLVERTAELLRCAPGEIGIDDSFDRLGFDSATAVGVTLELEDYLGRTVEPEVFYSYNTIRRLADHLASGGAPPGAPD
jgi:acyl carrier protein